MQAAPQLPPAPAVVLTASPEWLKAEAAARASWSEEQEREAAKQLQELRKAKQDALPFEAFLAESRARITGEFKAKTCRNYA